MRQLHGVPFSKQATSVLRELPTCYRKPNACGSATTPNRALDRIGSNGKGSIGFSAHGVRATASTIGGFQRSDLSANAGRLSPPGRFASVTPNRFPF